MTGIVIAAIVGLLLGAGVCFLIFRYSAAGVLRKAEEDAEIIKKNKNIIEIKQKKKDLIDFNRRHISIV